MTEKPLEESKLEVLRKELQALKDRLDNHEERIKDLEEELW